MSKFARKGQQSDEEKTELSKYAATTEDPVTCK
jgi:hypothetical protein